MIDRIKGELVDKYTNTIVVNCGGVGYLINVSLKTAEALPKLNTECEVLTILIPREDSINLYGFATKEEREVFKKITSISGIGPKIALGILSSVTTGEFINYISSGNTRTLEKLPGIGKKTAERLCLELKDKFKGSIHESIESPLNSGASNILFEEAVSALMSLGYNKAVSEKSVSSALKELNRETLTIEILIKRALKLAIR